MNRIPTQDDLDALVEYCYGKAATYHGMTYADGIRDMVEWLENEDTPRPDESDDS